MPRFDQTGPFGLGPMTGRGMGRCCGYSRRFFSPKNELAALEEEEKALLEEKEMIEEEINALREEKKALEE